MMTYSTLVSPRILAACLHDPAWRVFDRRFDLKDPDAGRRAYAAGPISGARYAHLDTDRSGPRSAASGRHPLPDADGFARRLGAWGVRRDTQVVVYDDAGGGNRRPMVVDVALVGARAGGPARRGLGGVVCAERADRRLGDGARTGAVPGALGWLDFSTMRGPAR
ncbi:MAG TPA: hypothetical protein ENI71_00565 [Chromatiales bacterium]|nr:hypothetical protein [Chromatiales bacterium]